MLNANQPLTDYCRFSGEQAQQDGRPSGSLHRQVHLQTGPEETVQAHEAWHTHHRRKYTRIPITDISTPTLTHPSQTEVLQP